MIIEGLNDPPLRDLLDTVPPQRMEPPLRQVEAMARGPNPDLLAFPIRGKLRLVSRSAWEALEGHDEVPGDFESNGCTMVPDQIQGHPVWPACRIHDWDYSLQGTLSREESDARFRRNVYTIQRLSGAGRVRATAVSLVYWRGVRRLGAPFFRGNVRATIRGKVVGVAARVLGRWF